VTTSADCRGVVVAPATPASMTGLRLPCRGNYGSVVGGADVLLLWMKSSQTTLLFVDVPNKQALSATFVARAVEKTLATLSASSV
jgi:hypothetical protein